MTVSIALMLIGTDEEPRWAAYILQGKSRAQDCCEAGHQTPEEAASHGAALAATWLSRYARSLTPPACGAVAIQKLEAA